jgi:hypothetical protein
MYTWCCSRRGRNLCICICREDYAQGDWGVSAVLCWVHNGFSERVLLILVRFGRFNESWHFVSKIRIWVCSLSQLCSWGLPCCGILCCIAGWLVPDVSEQSAHLIFKVWLSRGVGHLTLEGQIPCCHEMVGTNHLVRWHRIRRRVEASG